MKKVNYINSLIVLLLATGCGSSYKTAMVQTKFVRQSPTAHLPVLVDLNIDDLKVTASFSCKANWGIEYAKEQAVATALKKSNADVLYEPQYMIENTGRLYNVEVSGHPAHYKNFRQATSPLDTVGSVSEANIVHPKLQILNMKKH